MKIQIFYLLLLCLMVLGRGEVWAETDGISLTSFTSTEQESKTFSRIGSAFSVSANLTGGGGLSGSKFTVNIGTTITISPTNPNVKVLSIGFRNSGTGGDATNNLTCTINDKDAGTSLYGSKNATCTWTNSTDASSFNIVFSGNNEPWVYLEEIIVTYNVVYQGSLPYTWIFNYGENTWPYTTSSMLTSTETYWQVASVGAQSGYSNKTALSGNQLVDGSGSVISETKGLTFTASVGNVLTTLHWEVALQGSANVTIPAKAGQKVSVYAWWPAQTMTLTNAKEKNSGASTFTPVKGAATYEFTATADNVTLQVGSSMVFIYSIAVTKTAITRFNFKGGDANFTTYNYDSGLPVFAPILIINPEGAASSISYFTISNTTNSEVISIVKANPSSTSGSQVYFGDCLRRGKPGTSRVTFSYAGNDVYEPATFEADYTINKLVPTIAFAESGDQTKAFATGTYTNVASESTAYGRTITYSSSNTSVATVSSSGVVSFVNSGTTVITATATGDDYYETATASYTLTVNGSHTPTLKWTATGNGGTYTVDDLPYGNNQTYTATIDNNGGSSVSSSDIRYGVVEEYNGYLTVEATTGKITPTRKFADENLTEKTVQVYAYSIANGDRNPSPRIFYEVKIVKGSFSDELFKQTNLTVNVGCTIAPRNNLQSMRWDDLDDVTVTIKSGSAGIAGDGETTITSFKDLKYFDTKIGAKGDDKGKTIIEWFYPVFKGTSVGDVTFTVTLKSKLYGDKSGDFTLHVIKAETTTGFAWADGVKTKYTLYEGDYMLMPEISGFTNGNFDYSDGAVNYDTQHKYLYSRRWNSSTNKYEMVFNNANFHKGEGMPNFDITSDSEGSTVVTTASVDGDNVALIFWNTGSGNDNDRLLIYGNKPGTVYLKASDPQIKTRAISTIEIKVKSRSTINTDFDNVTSSMTFPYTWDFTTDYDWSSVIETGNGYWSLNGSTYDLDMQSNFNYDYADFDKNGLTWGSGKAGTNTSGSEIMAKPLVASITTDKVLRGFAGMQIKLGNNGTGSWYSKRDGIHIKPYSAGEPRLHINGGTHTFVLPTPTGDACPSTFKVFVKARALEAGKGTLWVKAEGKNPQNGYYNFSGVELNQDIIYSVDAAKGQTLTLDVEKVDIYWIAFSTEAKPIYQPTSTTYPASTYSYTKALDLNKSAEVNTGLTTYYASGFNSSTNSVTMTSLTGRVEANRGLMLKLPESNNTDDNKPSSSCYMIADPENSESYSVPTTFNNVTNYLIATGNTPAKPGRFSDDHAYTNFILTNTYHKILDNTENDVVTSTSGAITDDWKYVRTAGDIVVGANKAYLRLPGRLLNINASARAMSESTANSRTVLNIVFDDEQDVTGIQSLHTASNAGSDDDGWHTLQGVKVSTPTRGGLYIYKGKKIAVK